MNQITIDRREFEIQREMRKHHGTLVRMATRLFARAEKRKNYEINLDEDVDMNATKDLQLAQFRNVVDVALGAASIEEITNFLRYQIGRDERKWGPVKGGTAAKVIEDLEIQLSPSRKDSPTWTIAEKLKLDEERKQVLWVEFARLYLGYANRTFNYLKKKQEGR